MTAGVNVESASCRSPAFINPTGLQSIGENLYLETDTPHANLLQPRCGRRGFVMQNYVIERERR